MAGSGKAHMRPDGDPTITFIVVGSQSEELSNGW